MNKEYLYTDEMVTIIDENGKKKKEVYYDNLDQVLIVENVIETMENEINRLLIERKKYEKSKSDKLFLLVPLLGAGIFSLIGPLLVISMITGHNIISLVNDSFYGNYILSLTSMVFPGGLLLGILLSTMEYLQYQKDIKKLNGINGQLDYLKEQVVVQKEVLKDLQADKKKENENISDGIVRVNDIAYLKKLKSELVGYYKLGYNLDKYFRYYKRGKLNDNLPDDIDFSLAEKYIKKKKLVKKK